MKAQIPAKGISLIDKWDKAQSYHIECDCSSKDHAVKMWIEVNEDRDVPDVEVSFYVDTWTPFWDRGFNRIKTALKVLFLGINRQEHHFILNKQAALNLAEVIKTNVEKLDNR